MRNAVAPREGAGRGLSRRAARIASAAPTAAAAERGSRSKGGDYKARPCMRHSAAEIVAPVRLFFRFPRFREIPRERFLGPAEVAVLARAITAKPRASAIASGPLRRARGNPPLASVVEPHASGAT